MEQLSQITSIIALSMGVAWASGINLYAAVLMLGLLASTGNAILPAELALLTHPAVLLSAGFMFCVEFFADKTPGVDSAWDTLHTFIRIPAGAVLAAGALGDVNPALALSAALAGGGVAATAHATKASARLMINASPEPVTNWTASFTEDFAVVAGLWTALHYPELFIALFVVFLLLAAWLLPKLYRGVKRVGGFVLRTFSFVRSPST